MPHFHFHYHIEPDPQGLARIDAVNAKLDLMKENIMASMEELKQVLDTIDTKVANVKGDVDSLQSKLAAVPQAGLSAEQQTAIDDAVQHAQRIAESLGAIDTQVNPPAPSTPPPDQPA